MFVQAMLAARLWVKKMILNYALPKHYSPNAGQRARQAVQCGTAGFNLILDNLRETKAGTAFLLKFIGTLFPYHLCFP
jgi:hypothetical protein